MVVIQMAGHLVVRDWRGTVLVLLALATLPVQAEEKVQFLRDVAPVLLRRCSGCHGTRVSRGGFRLQTFADLLRAGESGNAPVVAGKPTESELFRRLVEADPELRMPREDDPLAAGDVALVKQWIVAGAHFDGGDPKATLASQLPPRRHPRPPEKYRVPVPVLSLAFSPDGRRLAVGGYHEVTIWDASSGRLLRRLARLPQRVHALSWTRSSDQLLVGGGSPGEYGEVSLVDAKTGQRERVFGTFEDLVLAATLSGDGRRVAAGSAGHETRVWSRENGVNLWKARVHSDWVTGVDFSKDDRFVVSSSRDQTLKVHLADSGTLFTTYNGHRRQLGKFAGRFSIYDVAFDRKSGRALSVGAGRAVRIWDPIKAQVENGTAADMEGRFFKAGHTRYFSHQFARPCFSLAVADGQAWIAGAEGTVKQFTIESLAPVRTYAGHSDWIYCLATAPGIDAVAAGSYNGEVYIWNRNDGRLIVRFLASPGLTRTTR